MFIPLEFKIAPHLGLLRSEIHLLVAVEKEITGHLQPLLSVREGISGVRVGYSNDSFIQVGDVQQKLLPEEANDVYLRQLVADAAWFIARQVYGHFTAGHFEQFLPEQVVLETLELWRETCHLGLYWDPEVYEVSLPMVSAWAKRQLFYLHHLGARPVSQHSWQADLANVSLDTRYAAFFLLLLLLRKMCRFESWHP